MSKEAAIKYLRMAQAEYEEYVTAMKHPPRRTTLISEKISNLIGQMK